MRILVLMKRFGANKDMVMQDFGRQIRLFENLAKKHKIDFFCPDYKKLERKDLKLYNMNFYIRPYSIPRHFKFLSELKRLIQVNKYDYIVSSTDPLLGILGYFYSKKFDVRHIYEMQDDYSVYNTSKIPFIKSFEKKVIVNSDLVVTVSDSLNKKISKIRNKKTITVQNGIDLKLFKKIDKNIARKRLKLPDGNILIYVGEISKFKGVDVLIEAFEKARETIANSYLLLSGKVIDVDIKKENVIYRECPKREDIVAALNASDVAIIPNPRNVFSQYCFPYKALEYMSAGLPIVATNVGDIGKILSRLPNSICKPNDMDSMVDYIIKKLRGKKKIDYNILLKEFSWENLASKIDSAL